MADLILMKILEMYHFRNVFDLFYTFIVHFYIKFRA